MTTTNKTTGRHANEVPRKIMVDLAAYEALVEACKTVTREAEPGQEMGIRQAIDALAGCYQAARGALSLAKG